MAQSLGQAMPDLTKKYPNATFVIDDTIDDDRTLYEGDAAGVMTMQYLLDNEVVRIDEGGAPDRVTIYITEEYI